MVVCLRINLIWDHFGNKQSFFVRDASYQSFFSLSLVHCQPWHLFFQQIGSVSAVRANRAEAKDARSLCLRPRRLLSTPLGPASPASTLLNSSRPCFVRFDSSQLFSALLRPIHPCFARFIPATPASTSKLGVLPHLQAYRAEIKIFVAEILRRSHRLSRHRLSCHRVS
jgi:hypothetical protein